MSEITIRPLTSADIARLPEMDLNFEADAHLAVEKTVEGLNVTWRLVETPLDPPFVSVDYNMDEQDQAEIAKRLKENDGLYLAAERNGRLVALLDLEREAWRDTGVIWNIVLDRAYRRQGLGTRLMERAIRWARRRGLRALMAETQTNNLPACRFYQKTGFQLCGVDDHFYSNDDIGLKEVALFWYYEL
jgi:streptothricin acetyltransferase